MTHAYLSCVTLSLKMHDSPSNKSATSLSSRADRSPGSELAHMSALGDQQTSALQKGMSAIPPIATAKANFRTTPCPLYPRKRTCAAHKLMSALGQKQTCSDLSDVGGCRRGQVARQAA